MKKIFLLLICLLFLSACSLDNSTQNSSLSSGQNNISYDENEINNQINNYKSSNFNQMPKIKDESGGPEIELKNLAAKYNQALMRTNLGNIKFQFYGEESPLTVNNFMNLAEQGFYDGTRFHRIIEDFMVQGGDPNSKNDDWETHGIGGPGYKFQDEFNKYKLVRGSLAMANSGPSTNGSQFFIVTAEETPWLDGRHTNFGYIIEGLDVLSKMEAVKTNGKDHPLEDITIEGIELLHSDDTYELDEGEKEDLEASNN